MPNRVTDINNLSLQHSVSVAHQALEKGGSVKVGRKGNLEVTGGTFFGRVVRYLKIRLFPDKVRQQNHAVIAALNKTISKEFGTDRQLNIGTVISSAESKQRFLKSIINSVSDIRAGSEYTPAQSTEGEVRNTFKFGFAGNIRAQKSRQGQSRSSRGETVTAREQLFWYNRTMGDLHNRFPKLRNTPAIKTFKLDMPSRDKEVFASYERRNRSMELASFPLKKASKLALRNSQSGYLTPKQDFSGLIHHEYAHHLSLLVVPEKLWIPKLVEALKAGGMSHTRIKNVGGKPAFNKETAEKIVKTVGKYAATDAHEFAAEIISWYMNPEYGKSVATMPDYLENWVKECFPMLDTG